MHLLQRILASVLDFDECFSVLASAGFTTEALVASPECAEPHVNEDYDHHQLEPFLCEQAYQFFGANLWFANELATIEHDVDDWENPQKLVSAFLALERLFPGLVAGLRCSPSFAARFMDIVEQSAEVWIDQEAFERENRMDVDEAPVSPGTQGTPAVETYIPPGPCPGEIDMVDADGYALINLNNHDADDADVNMDEPWPQGTTAVPPADVTSIHAGSAQVILPPAVPSAPAAPRGDDSRVVSNSTTSAQTSSAKSGLTLRIRNPAAVPATAPTPASAPTPAAAIPAAPVPAPLSAAAAAAVAATLPTDVQAAIQTTVPRRDESGAAASSAQALQPRPSQTPGIFYNVQPAAPVADTAHQRDMQVSAINLPSMEPVASPSSTSAASTASRSISPQTPVTSVQPSSEKVESATSNVGKPQHLSGQKSRPAVVAFVQARDCHPENAIARALPAVNEAVEGFVDSNNPSTAAERAWAIDLLWRAFDLPFTCEDGKVRRVDELDDPKLLAEALHLKANYPMRAWGDDFDYFAPLPEDSAEVLQLKSVHFRCQALCTRFEILQRMHEKAGRPTYRHLLDE